MIVVKDLKKKYPDGTAALKGVSFSIDKKITCILGRNGAGKTTLIRILSTQLRPSSGSAKIEGHDIVNEPMSARNDVVSIPQEAIPINYVNPVDFVVLYLSARGMGINEARRRADNAIKRVGLWSVRDKPSDELSGGMKRKIFVAMALAADAPVTFLDEPTTGLDPLSRREVWAAIKELKGQVVLTTHYMEEAQELSDEVIMMESGKVISKGSIKKLMRPFEGMVRVESKEKQKGAVRIGNTYISYVDRRRAESYVIKGSIIKPVTLDDLFVKRGVELES